MGSYILKRILLFIPTLLVLSVIGFAITVNAPGDPVDRLFTSDNSNPHNTLLTRRLKQEKRHQLGLDLPVFYLSIGTLADINPYPFTADKDEREAIVELSRYAGNASAVKTYEETLRNTADEIETLPEGAQKDEIASDIKILYAEGRYDEIGRNIYILDGLLKKTGRSGSAASLVGAYESLEKSRQAWKMYIPSIHWYGLNNQYHRWLSNILLHGNLGVSYHTQLPLMQQLKSKIGWSFILSFSSLLLAYLISIPIGLYAAYRQNGWFDRLSATLLFALYSIPTFFGGLLLLLLFANPDMLSWFPESGIADPTIYNPDWPFYERVMHHLPYLVLPVITYTYSYLAFYSRQMRIGAVEVMQQDFIRTARAKGLPDRSILWKHVFRNALLPIVTLFADAFPLAVAGAVIIETIFAIPGMGQGLYSAVLTYDYPVIVGVFLIFGAMTLIGYLVSDILYAVVDPRISYKNR